MNNKKVLVGMSGGVDSSVAAYLLKESGYDVVGVTMRMWDDNRVDTSDATITAEAGDAKRVAKELDIPHYIMDFRNDFKKYVIDDFICEYNCGRTPNPCVVCNRYVKFAALMDRASQMDIDYIATGHYAQIKKLSDADGGRYTLKRCEVSAKDQTYALYRLTQDQLEHTIMPLGTYSKDEIRSIAGKIGLQVAHKKDSQEICFIPDHDYAGYIEKNSGVHIPEGNFILEDGTVLGRHLGITHYTVGQRRGLGIALGERTFVKEIRPNTNEIVLCKDEQLWTDTLIADEMNWMGIEKLGCDGMEVYAKIRYNHIGEKCKLFREGETKTKVVFDKPVRAVTPGQSVVFYSTDGYVYGGGNII